MMKEGIPFKSRHCATHRGSDPFSLLRASCPSPFGPASPFAPLLRRSGYLSFWVSKKKVTRPRQRTKPERSEAGLEHLTRTRAWIPAFAGMTALSAGQDQDGSQLALG